LVGNADIEDSLERLDKLTQEEARMASAEMLRAMYSFDGRVMGVDDRVKSVEGKVQDVHSDVHKVENKVQDVEGKVQDVRGDVQEVGHKVQGVDDRMQGIGSDVKDISSEVRGLNQVNRSLFLQHLLIVPRADAASQRLSSEIVFYDGFRLQIRPSTITLHAKLVTTVQLNGFFKAVFSSNGNPLTPCCGYTENVRYSWPSPCGDP
jgi:archaellum component FlaC